MCHAARAGRAHRIALEACEVGKGGALGACAGFRELRSTFACASRHAVRRNRRFRGDGSGGPVFNPRAPVQLPAPYPSALGVRMCSLPPARAGLALEVRRCQK